VLSTADCFDNPQQNDGTKQCYQHGWDGDGIVDCPDAKQWTEEVTSQECTYDAHDDIEQQTLLRIGMHDPAGNIADDGSSDEVYDKVHFFFILLCEYFKYTVACVGLIPALF
jgi:hypothetical protein